MSTTNRPNFLIIIADDLGFSDLGCYGGEIRTPNLDKLAQDGLRLTGFHTASACSPTRAMLLSGTDSHLAGLGQMYERIHRNEQNEKHYEGKVGYEGILSRRIAALSEILNQKAPGEAKGTYKTLISGKWHLGFNEQDLPPARGFEKNWGLLPGCGHHYKFPVRNDVGKPPLRFMTNDYADGSRVFYDDNEALPDDFYSTSTYTDKMLDWLSEEDDRPFYAMMTYTAPHWPLQAPQEFIKHYRGVYDDGPSALRQKRMKRLVELGLVPQSAIDNAHPMLPVFKSREWEELSPEAQKKSARKMEAFSGMVECLDHHVGRILDLLEKQERLENTFIVFMSDNGAEGALLEATPLSGRNTAKILDKYYDNSLDNIGNPSSFVYYGPRWAQAATAPSKLYKCWVTEGGIRCPCIVRYPKLADKMQGGAISHEFTTVMDLCPTILELANISHPGTEFQGRKVYQPKGRSWLPWLNTKAEIVHGDDHVVGWELFGQQAIRKGDWKAMFIPKPAGSEKWELYNLKEDPGETIDLAEKESAKLDEMLAHWETYEAETGMVPAVYDCYGMDDDAIGGDDW